MVLRLMLGKCVRLVGMVGIGVWVNSDGLVVMY